MQSASGGNKLGCIITVETSHLVFGTSKMLHSFYGVVGGLSRLRVYREPLRASIV